MKCRETCKLQIAECNFLGGWMLLFTFYFLLLTFTTGCGNNRQVFSKTQLLMGTIAEIKVIDDNPERAKEVIKKCFDRIKEIEDKMSFQDPKSELSFLNQNAGKNIKVSKDLFYVLEKSLNYSKLSDGAFDVTIGPLTELWGFDRNKRIIPSQDKIAQRVRLVDYRQVKLNSKKREVLLEQKGMKIDLGAVAKGYAVEEVCKIIKEAGIKDALVDIGRNIKVMGKNPDGNIWKIGLQHPRKPYEILSILPLENMSVATSGDYEQFFIHKGIRYHHILDPKSGYPTNVCISVTIITPSAMIADILSTAVFVLGEVAGMDLIEELDMVEGIIVTDSGIKVSSGLEGKIKLAKFP